MKRSTVVTVSLLFGFIVFILLVLLSVKVIFSVRSIEIEGNTRYPDEALLEAIGLKEGDVIFFANEKRFASALAAKYPYVYAVKLIKDYPSSVKIIITEEIPNFYFESAGQTGVVSKSEKVLYLGKELPEEYRNLKKVSLPGISLAMEGYPLILKEKGDNRALSIVLQAIERQGIADQVYDITVNSRFDIKMKYTDRFLVLFGDSNDFELKIRFVKGMIATLDPDESGTINAKNPSSGFLVLDD